MKNSKRSQVQMLESIAIVVIVIIMIVIGIVFWNKVKRDDIQDTSLEYQDISVIELAKIASELPELKCYNANIATEVNCFDWYKILALNKTLHDPASRDAAFAYYNNYFHNSRITFQQVYPSEINMTIYDNNITSSRALQISIPIIIERNYGREGIKGFGWIIVEGYYR